MASIVVTGDTSGSITLAAPAVAGTNTLTLPANTGTVITTASSGQSIPKAALPTGSVLQVVNATTQTSTTVASATPADTTLTATITPTSSTSKILVIVQQQARFSRSSLEQGVGLTLLRGATTLVNQSDRYGGYIYGVGITSVEMALQIPIVYLDSPATTSSTTYKTQGRVEITSNSGTVIFQQESQMSTITLMEIAA
jgi:hypothetical protein